MEWDETRFDGDRSSSNSARRLCLNMVQVDIRRHIFIINTDWEEMIASGDGTALEKSFLVDNL